MGRLYFLIGLPRSGKTTYAKRWIDARDGGNPRVVLSGDDFRHAIHEQAYVENAEGLVFATMDISIRALLRSGFDVLVDETCTTEATLRRYINIDINAIPIFIPGTEEVCVDRAIKCGQPELIPPIQRMAKQLKYLKENFPEIVESIVTEVETRKKAYRTYKCQHLSERSLETIPACTFSVVLHTNDTKPDCV